MCDFLKLPEYPHTQTGIKMLGIRTEGCDGILPGKEESVGYHYWTKCSSWEDDPMGTDDPLMRCGHCGNTASRSAIYRYG